MPQLIRHVQMLNKAMCDVGTGLYLRIGTTGTGGIGLNISYTHNEDKPSSKLMSKTAFAFLCPFWIIVLMARTPDGPMAKEIKPAYYFILEEEDLRTLMTSIGLPILISDGSKIIRGPRLNIPESIYNGLKIKDGDVDICENKGWVDYGRKTFWFGKIGSNECSIHGTTCTPVEHHL